MHEDFHACKSQTHATRAGHTHACGVRGTGPSRSASPAPPGSGLRGGGRVGVSGGTSRVGTGLHQVSGRGYIKCRDGVTSRVGVSGGTSRGGVGDVTSIPSRVQLPEALLRAGGGKFSGTEGINGLNLKV